MKGFKMFAMCKKTIKGFQPEYDENGTPILLTLAQALQFKMNNPNTDKVFQDFRDVFDVEDIDIQPLKG